MKKYTKPELNITSYEAENIMALSGATTNQTPTGKDYSSINFG